MLDIDYKGQRTWTDAEQTVRSVIEALPGEPLVYQSSQSGGIRLIWFLQRKTQRQYLHQWTKSKLLENKLVVRPGICEIQLGTAPDRLPFGYHSMLLDSLTFEPHYHLTLSETLEIAQNHCQWFAVSPEFDCHDLPSTRRGHSDDYKQLVDTCLKNGLPPDVSTNECLQKLAYYGRVEQRMDNGPLRQFLRNWISQGHNGHSTRINNGSIQDIYNQIDRIIVGLRAFPAGHGRQIKRMGLSEAELKRLLDYSGNYKVLHGAFRILSFAKAKLYRQVTADWCYLSTGGGTNKWGTVFNNAEDIPNRARNSHLFVDLGKWHLRRLGTPFASNTARLIEELERLGILGFKRKAWPDGRKVRQFWVNFPFDLTDTRLFDNFDEALWVVVGFAQIKQRFSRYQANRIAQRMEHTINIGSYGNAECQDRAKKT